METKPPESLIPKMMLGAFWIISLVAVGYVGFAVGQGSKLPETKTETEVLSSLVTQPPQSSAQPTVAPSTALPNTPACEKSGYAQKWEFLDPYVVKEKDTVQGIAASELGDATRANEVMQINGIPLVAGSTIYLPPSIVTKSNGYLKQVHGKIIEKNASMWHLSFNSDEKGLGILIPTYWFEKISTKDMYQVGDCVTVFLDDGNTVYSIERQ